MCGIDFEVIRNGSHFASPSESIARRGPDYQETHTITSENTGYSLRFTSSVLSLRGNHIGKQPMISQDFIFQWNGEVYDGLTVGDDECDTEVIFRHINKIGNDIDRLLGLFNTIRGEYAFVLYAIEQGYVLYGRDFFGRRSLVHKLDYDAGCFRLSSVIPKGDGGWSEVEANGIWQLQFAPAAVPMPKLHHWGLSPLSFKIPIISDLVSESSIDAEVDTFYGHLMESLRRRILTISHLPEATREHAPIAVLFSGGIDSVVLTALIDRVLPLNIPVDLINVAFYNDRFVRNSSKKSTTELNVDPYDSVPDRAACKQAYAELRIIAPIRQWNMVMVNVSRDEYEEHKERVKTLMKPSDTVMDLSIAIAIWFASRGRGRLYDPSTGLSTTIYESKSKVILLGMGADEQLGGYGRHRTAFEMRGWLGVVQEMQMELDRISKRNLGRDDRCIADHGKEARFPFLDEDLVSYLCALPVTAKCDFHFPRGQGEKRLVRLLAKRLGFSDKIAFLPKRAIQFGAKTAKMDDNHEDGQQTIE